MKSPLFLVDWPVLTEMRMGIKAHPALHAWANRTVPATVHLSVATVLDVYSRICESRALNTEQSDALSVWLTKTVLPGFGKRVLPVDALVALEAAALAPGAAPQCDVLLAATARSHQMVIASNRREAFQSFGVSVFDPWTGNTYSSNERKP